MIKAKDGIDYPAKNWIWDIPNPMQMMMESRPTLQTVWNNTFEW